MLEERRIKDEVILTLQQSRDDEGRKSEHRVFDSVKSDDASGKSEVSLGRARALRQMQMRVTKLLSLGPVPVGEVSKRCIGIFYCLNVFQVTPDAMTLR